MLAASSPVFGSGVNQKVFLLLLLLLHCLLLLLFLLSLFSCPFRLLFLSRVCCVQLSLVGLTDPEVCDPSSFSRHIKLC